MNFDVGRNIYMYLINTMTQLLLVSWCYTLIIKCTPYLYMLLKILNGILLVLHPRWFLSVRNFNQEKSLEPT